LENGGNEMATRSDIKTSALHPQQTRASRLTLAQKRNITGYIFIAPFILGVLFWVVIPALVAVYLTFHQWNLISPPKFVGLANIQALFKDPILPISLKATFIFTAVSVPLGLIFSFFLATLLNNKIRGMGIFRTIFYLPSIIPAVANALLWAWMYNTEFGLVNVFVRALGGSKIPWLQEPGWAIPAFIILSLWTVGGSMVIFLAGLQGIPEIYYEAAEIDGAGRWAKMRYVTLPLMSPIFFFNLVIGFISSFQVFVNAFLITDGGPQNSTLFLVLYIYRSAFSNLKMGYAATLSWLLFFILMVLSVIVFRYIGTRVYYENPSD
jgi:multiple sugar transport system permease protein